MFLCSNFMSEYKFSLAREPPFKVQLFWLRGYGKDGGLGLANSYKILGKPKIYFITEYLSKVKKNRLSLETKTMPLFYLCL